MFHCNSCPLEERIGRRCPEPPLEWRSLKRQGVKFPEGANAKTMCTSLRQQVQDNPDWTADLKGEVLGMAEVLHSRHIQEKVSGVQFGQPHEDLCAWYRLVVLEAPEVSAWLSTVDLDSNGRRYKWLPGAQWDQPAYLIDVARIRAELPPEDGGDDDG